MLETLQQWLEAQKSLGLSWTGCSFAYHEVSRAIDAVSFRHCASGKT